MKTRKQLAIAIALAGILPCAGAAQGPPQGPPPGGGGPQGPGGMGPAMGERAIVAQFDKDKNRRLNAEERREARLWLESQPAGGPGGRGGRGAQPPATITPGESLKPADVKTYTAKEPLYDLATLRTFFFTFENDDWLKELVAFNNTDVEVPATLTVDGRMYRDVGLHARGASSFMGVPMGMKHSLNVSMDFVNESQTLQGYTTLNLLNSHTDPTFLRSVLYLQAARDFVPAPKANYARVVLNGESWGVYVSAQQFNKGFINEWFKTTDGARWKVPGRPGGRGGLEYLGDDPAPYKGIYEIKTKDDAESWRALINLCRTLNTTPPDALEKALAPMLNVDGVLKFLALEVALVNNDGYWVRASDYSIYRDPKGVFHLFPHDANETYGPGGGGRGRGPGGPPVMIQGPPPAGGQAPPPPGGRAGGPQGGRGGGMGNAELDPMVGLTDATKPLRSKLLAVPALRDRYLGYLKQIAKKWLDWNVIGPMTQRYQALISDDVMKDTRKLDSNEAFTAAVANIRAFAERRRELLLNYSFPK